MFAQLLYYIPSYFIAAQLGLVIFVYVRLGVALVAMPIHIYLCRKMLKVSPFYLWHDGKRPFLAVLAMGICIVLVKRGIATAMLGMPLPMVLAMLFAVGVSVYVVTLWLLDSSFVVQNIQLIRRAVLS